MTWITTIDGATPLERVLRRRPQLFERVRDFVARPWSDDLVDPALLELCRLLIALTLGCAPELQIRYQSAIDKGLSEEKIAALSSWSSSSLFDERERACLKLAEQYTIDAHGITDADFEAVTDHLTSQETVAFVYSLATFDGMARLRRMLDIEAPSDVTVVPSPAPDHGPMY